MNKLIDWYKEGTPFLWVCAAAIALSVILVLGIVGFIGYQSLSHFWPSNTHLITLQNESGQKSKIVAEYYQSKNKVSPAGKYKDILLKTGNRDIFGLDFRWVKDSSITASELADKYITFERREWGNLYGIATKIVETSSDTELPGDLWGNLQDKITETSQIHHQIEKIQNIEIGAINYEMEQIRLHKRSLELRDELTEMAIAEAKLEVEQLDLQYNELNNKLTKLSDDLNKYSLYVDVFSDNGSKTIKIKVSSIVRAYTPNNIGTFEKISIYIDRIDEYIFDSPREANTEGGVFPAIFGTVLMVFIMTIFVTPFGILAAIYLREYSKQNVFTRIIRISVVNLAGVPSVVYGVFGLGFFVYILGGEIDALFYPEALPSPTFGTPGILWASITLALLTLPVVIVSTEEGLARIPRAFKEGSLALGATKSETLWKVIIPISTPALITGMILAIARAAGEVAPLMLVGVVKLAPSLPLDGNFPYLHMDRKFMHLGFHIYDVGFQSPNVEAARPLVFATAFLLIAIIIFLNLFAFSLRNRLREKYKSIAG
ncbi:MAG: phosphate ABC transporter permease PstA [Gammaproteobacteria bacterium]|nr:MAG: phosphate ABC transporter permease PstA [Gammaproteobacteria bacterium]